MSRLRGIRAKVGIASGAVLLAGLGMGATAAPAQAAQSDCSAGALCAYLATDYAGDPGEVYGDNSDLRQYEKFNNAKSAYNNGNSCDVRIYTLLGYEGSSYLLKRGTGIGDLTTFNGGQFEYGIAANKWVC